MNAIIRRHGGGGIVVSLHECLARYPQIRALLAEAESSCQPIREACASGHWSWCSPGC